MAEPSAADERLAGVITRLDIALVLHTAGIDPPTVPLEASDLAASLWTQQEDVEWVLLTGSLSSSHRDTVIRPVEPAQLVPYTLQWTPDRAQTAAVARFVHYALSSELPAGWLTQPGHLRHDQP